MNNQTEFIQFITHKHFGYILTKGQAELVAKILFEKEDRISLSACTRYGKTRCLAIAIGLTILYKDNKKFILIGPQARQADKLRDYIADLILSSEQLKELADLSSAGPRRLKKEASKQRQTFKNGCEYIVLSASGEAERIMGEGPESGGGIIIVDEACLVNDSAYTKIIRMLGDAPGDIIYIESYNPWTKNTKAYPHSTSPNYDHIRIDHRQAIKEGRTTKEHIEEMRRNMSKTEFTVLYESRFPEDTETTLFKHKWIERAMKEPPKTGEVVETIWGLDVAAGGADFTVLCKINKTNTENKIIYIIDRFYKYDISDTTKIVNKITQIVPKDEILTIDSIGIGKGVYDKLSDLAHDCYAFIASESAHDRQRFRNRKAESYWNARNFFEDNLVYFANTNTDNFITYKKELSLIEKDTSSGKIKIIDPSKSPDFADAFVYALSRESGFSYISSVAGKM